MTERIDNRRTNRREFFGSCVALLRGAAVAAVATGGVWLIRREDGTGPDLPKHPTCPPDGLCRRCPSVQHCGRPEAESYRIAKPSPAEVDREGRHG